MNPVSPRLLWLHLLSRRTCPALILIITIAAVLRAVQPWTQGPGEFAAMLPLVLAVAAAVVISASTRSPFGEPERATHPLPRLRLIQVTTLLLPAAGLLGLARLGHDPLSAIRNLAGFTGLALMTAAVISAPLSWITPLAYAIYCGGPIDIHAITLWSWPALPAGNHPATLIALLLLGAGITSITRAGARDRHADPG
jgi:hypothetical protein